MAFKKSVILNLCGSLCSFGLDEPKKKLKAFDNIFPCSITSTNSRSPSADLLTVNFLILSPSGVKTLSTASYIFFNIAPIKS